MSVADSKAATASIRSTMLSCARAIALAIAGITALALVAYGLYLAGPSIGTVLGWIGDGITFTWYGWAHVLTRDYTSVTPATLIEWASLLVMVWAICVAVKLHTARHKAWRTFMLAAVLIYLAGVIPANCALWATSDDFCTGLFSCASSATVFMVAMGSFAAVLLSVYALLEVFL